MKKLIFVFTFILLVTMLSATIDWSGAIWPNSGTDQVNGIDITMYYQIYKAGVTDAAGQGADISATLYYRLSGETTYQSVAMTYLGDSGNNDEYTAAIPNTYFDSGDTVEFYCEGYDASDDTYSYGTDQDGAGPFDSAAPGTYNIVAGLNQDVTVTFQVFMGYEDASSYSGGVSVQGSVAPIDWTPGSTTMVDTEADMIYSVDVVFSAGSNPELNYKYMKSGDGGATWSWEDYPGGGNRIITIDDSSPTMIIDPPEIFSSDDTLPVELSAFTAVFAGSTPTIYWTTQSETNNSGWNLYRSQTEDYSQAMNINNELIAGAGTTSQPTNYTYDDEYPVQAGQTYWYWLESVENNGTTDNYGPITLDIPGEGGDEQLPQLTKLVGNHPNPFNPETTIEFQIKEGQNGKLTIYNSKGQVLETTTVTPQDTNYTWKGDKYGSGVYFYKLETEYFSQIKKMIMLK